MSPWLARRWYDAVFWISSPAFTLGWSLRVVGRRNMPETGPALVIANHQSFFINDNKIPSKNNPLRMLVICQKGISNPICTILKIKACEIIAFFNPN